MARIRAEEITLADHLRSIAGKGGRARAKPTVCPRCKQLQPSARAAWVHCRKPRRRLVRQAKAQLASKPAAKKGK